MNRSHWMALLALAGVAVVVLLLALGGFWIVAGARGGIMAWGASWRGMMGRLCPSCGGVRGLLGRPRTLLFLGLFLLVPVGVLLLLVALLIWLIHRGTSPASPQRPS